MSIKIKPGHSLFLVFFTLLLPLSSACSVRRYAINMVGDALASGNSVYESEEDIELVGQALPFGLKLTETLLGESPRHPGLLITACRGYVLYSYAFVDYPAELAEEEDLDRARALRSRARKFYLRAHSYCMRGLERWYPGLENAMMIDPQGAVSRTLEKKRERDLPFLYWTAAALGLAISTSLDDAALLARLPEVEALLDRALALDGSWNNGSLYEFKVQLAGSKVGAFDEQEVTRSYQKALSLSSGRHAGLFVTYAEAVAIPNQDRDLFLALIDRALSVDPDVEPENRLINLLAQRRARFILERMDDLILSDEPIQGQEGQR